MATKKSSTTSRKTKPTGKSSAAKGRTTAATTAGASDTKNSLSSIAGSIGSLLTAAVSGRLNNVLMEVKDRVASMVAEDAPKALEEAQRKVVKATGDLVEWGKEHPVKAAAAAAALIAASTFIYSTIASHESGSGSKKSAKAR